MFVRCPQLTLRKIRLTFRTYQSGQSSGNTLHISECPSFAWKCLEFTTCRAVGAYFVIALLAGPLPLLYFCSATTYAYEHIPVSVAAAFYLQATIEKMKTK